MVGSVDEERTHTGTRLRGSTTVVDDKSKVGDEVIIPGPAVKLLPLIRPEQPEQLVLRALGTEGLHLSLIHI